MYIAILDKMVSPHYDECTKQKRTFSKQTIGMLIHLSTFFFIIFFGMCDFLPLLDDVEAILHQPVIEVNLLIHLNPYILFTIGQIGYVYVK